MQFTSNTATQGKKEVELGCKEKIELSAYRILFQSICSKDHSDLRTDVSISESNISSHQLPLLHIGIVPTWQKVCKRQHSCHHATLHSMTEEIRIIALWSPKRQYYAPFL